MNQRAMQHKIEKVKTAGGTCHKCAYHANLAALSFHHTDPNRKTQQFNMTRLRYKLDKQFYDEFKSCILLCANCHMEEHYPHMATAILSQLDWPDPIPEVNSIKHTHCVQCGEELTGRQRQFCSKTCNSKYQWLHRDKKTQKLERYTQCIVCDRSLDNNQRKFCSVDCKNAYHQSYERQQERGIGRKLILVEQLGGCCSECGYDTNLAALNFHHVESDEKDHKLDLRQLGNRSWTAIIAEIDKCVLVCANCHAAIHNPKLAETAHVKQLWLKI